MLQGYIQAGNGFTPSLTKDQKLHSQNAIQKQEDPAEKLHEAPYQPIEHNNPHRIRKRPDVNEDVVTPINDDTLKVDAGKEGVLLANKQYEYIVSSVFRQEIEPEIASEILDQMKQLLVKIPDKEWESQNVTPLSMVSTSPSHHRSARERLGWNDHMCSKVCSVCSQFLTLQWSALCQKQCSNGGEAFSACLVTLMRDM